MRKIIAIVGLLALGAVGWAVFGDDITDTADDVKSEVQAEVYNKTQSVVDSIKP